METLQLLLQPLFITAFHLLGAPVTRLEVLAFASSITMVLFNIRVNPWGWPFAIVGSMLYFDLFWNSRLYGDACLQIFFAVLAFWGLWQWLRGTEDNGRKLEVRYLDHRQRVILLIALAIAWPAMGLFLKRFTDTDVPWWDAFPTAASIIGQWLMGRKRVEAWITWVVVNVVSTALFAYKGLWLTAVLYAIFFVLSFSGWRAWHRIAAKKA
jgi:nicotinamide mononucleotide transporter